MSLSPDPASSLLPHSRRLQTADWLLKGAVVWMVLALGGILLTLGVARVTHLRGMAQQPGLEPALFPSGDPSRGGPQRGLEVRYDPQLPLTPPEASRLLGPKGAKGGAG